MGRSSRVALHRNLGGFSRRSRRPRRGASQDSATPVLLAASSGHAGCLDILIKGGASLENYVWVRTCLRRAEPSRRLTACAFEQEVRTPLIAAAAKNHDACVRLLIKAGVDIEAGRQVSSRWSRTVQAAPTPSDRGRFVSAPQGRDGLTAAHHAASRGALTTLQLLINAGCVAGEAAATNSRRTLLRCAVGAWSLACVDLLLDHGADVNARGHVRPLSRSQHIHPQGRQHDSPTFLAHPPAARRDRAPRHLSQLHRHRRGASRCGRRRGRRGRRASLAHGSNEFTVPTLLLSSRTACRAGPLFWARY